MNQAIKVHSLARSSCSGQALPCGIRNPSGVLLTAEVLGSRDLCDGLVMPTV